MTGLTEEELAELSDIFKRFDAIESVILFGSRALGTHKRTSDIDLALKGKTLNLATLAKVKYILEEETTLPYFFDIVIYDTIENDALRKHIDENGKKLFSQNRSI